MQRMQRYSNLVRMCVVGVGDGGGQTVDRLIQAGVGGVDYIALNSDYQSLQRCEAPTRLLIGQRTTRGYGTGGDPQIGARAAQESLGEIRQALKGAELVFITAGLGGGLGSGAAPLVAQAARDLGALTLVVVTRPFPLEGRRRDQMAEASIQQLREVVDTLIVAPHSCVGCASDAPAGLPASFSVLDNILRQTVEALRSLVNTPGLINLDFADLRAIMALGGAAIIATGHGRGPDRARQAAGQALQADLLGIPIDGARGVLMNFVVGQDATLYELQQAADMIRQRAHPDVNLIWGLAHRPGLQDELRLTIIATGFQTPTPAASVLEKILRQAALTPLPSPPQIEISPPAAAPPPDYARARPASRFSPANWQLPGFWR